MTVTVHLIPFSLLIAATLIAHAIIFGLTRDGERLIETLFACLPTAVPPEGSPEPRPKQA